MPNDRDAWLARVVEEPIDPSLPICDPHHHLWDRPGNRYLLDEIVADVGTGHNVVSTVFVECGSMYRADGPREMRHVGETEFVQGIAAQSAGGNYGPSRIAKGIVGMADLRLGDPVAAVLDAQIAASPNRFRGIRYSASWDAAKEVEIARTAPFPGLLADATFRRGFAHLGPRDLTFEAWVYHPQIPEVADLARAFPGTTIILDHVGGPLGVGPYAGAKEEAFETWKRGVAAAAEPPNVVVKLGGLGMTRCGLGLNERPDPPTSAELAATIGPHINWCIEQFGVERCMFESNFPVDKVSYSYGVLWNAFKLLTKDFTPAERAALFHDNAARVYRLDPLLPPSPAGRGLA